MEQPNMSQDEFDFRYSHKREHETIEGRKAQGEGILTMVIGLVLGFFVPPLFLLILLGLGRFAWGKMQEWAAKG
jgi:hypothetical protein